MPQNLQIHLVSRPKGEPLAENFQALTLDTPALQDNQVLVKHEYLSLDPYMRGRMNDVKSYTLPQALNSVMIGGTVGEVVESRHSGFAAGDKVVGMGGWQTYSVVDANTPGALRKIDTKHVPISHYLGAVGMPGVTAWYGLVKIIEPQAGQTLVVSAATGAVGSAFAALSKARGCRTVGVAGDVHVADRVEREPRARRHRDATRLGDAEGGHAGEAVEVEFHGAGDVEDGGAEVERGQAVLARVAEAGEGLAGH